MTPGAEPPRGPLSGPLGAMASRLYGWEIARRNRRYDAGRSVVRFDRPVISVGNLSVGGTGKTPMVMQVLDLLLAAGQRPCVAMRGYGSRAGPSDEAEEYRRRFPDVPVVAQPNRTLGLINLFGAEHVRGGPASDCIVLDDGFQHRRIARDLDIVLIDASRDPLADRLLPAGWMREPLSSLRRAGLVVLTHAELVSAADVTALDLALAGVRGRAPEAVARHEWHALTLSRNGSDPVESPAWLRGKRALAVCAIGNPEAFLAEAERVSGAPLAARIVLRDHHTYSDRDAGRIAAEAARARADVILTTEKDWSKLAHLPLPGLPVARPKLRLSFDRGGNTLADAILETVARGAPE